MDDGIVNEYYRIIVNKLSQADILSAKRTTEKLLYNFPNDENGYYYLGVCEFALENYENSVKNYVLALRLNPAFAKAYFNLGVSYYTLNMTDAALVNIGKALIVFSKLRNEDAKSRCTEALNYILAERERGVS